MPESLIKLFISHSSKDEVVAEQFVELLRAALHLRADEIRCTSVDGYRLPGGAHTEEQLRREVMEAAVCIGLISSASLDSLYVAFELGARWGANRPLIPLLAPGVEPGILRGPLGGRNALHCTRPQLYQLVEDVARHLGTQPASPAAYERYVARIVEDTPGADDTGGPASERVVAPEQDRRTPKQDWSSLVLFVPQQGDFVLVDSRRIETEEPRDPWAREPNAIRLTLVPDDPKSAARLAGLRSARGSIGLAYGSDAYDGQVTEAKQIRQDGEEVWQVRFEPQSGAYGGTLTEIATEGYSADDIAELRARRILLDEGLPGGRRQGLARGSMLESLVQGMNTLLKVERSPFPALFQTLGDNPPLFLAACRLFGVLYLRISGTVEHVYRLDPTLAKPDALHIDFEGQRRRVYDNVEPPIIRIEGTCQLSR